MKLDNFQNNRISIWMLTIWLLLYGYFYDETAYNLIFLLVGYKLTGLCVDIISHLAYLYDSRYLRR